MGPDTEKAGYLVEQIFKKKSMGKVLIVNECWLPSCKIVKLCKNSRLRYENVCVEISVLIFLDRAKCFPAHQFLRFSAGLFGIVHLYNGWTNQPKHIKTIISLTAIRCYLLAACQAVCSSRSVRRNEDGQCCKSW